MKTHASLKHGGSRREFLLAASALATSSPLARSFNAADAASGREHWCQLKYDERRSGQAPNDGPVLPLSLVAAIPLQDAILTSPVVSADRAYIVDGSGGAACVDLKTMRLLWRYQSRATRWNYNNVSSPAIVGDYLHFGTTGGYHCVLKALTGQLVNEIDCCEPIFSAPAVAGGHVYGVTLGAQVYALKPNGELVWKWDYLKHAGFAGNRWSGTDWSKHKHGRVDQGDNFLCTRDLAVYGKVLVFSAGGTVVWLEDAGDTARLRAIRKGGWSVTSGLTLGSAGEVYWQWHGVDNVGAVWILKSMDDKVHKVGDVPGAVSNTTNLLSFSGVSLHGKDVLRTRPEQGFGLCRHAPDRKDPEVLCPHAGTASPVIVNDTVIYGDLRGAMHFVSLSDLKTWTFTTAAGKPISAPVAVCNGHVYFGGEDGYFYVLGPQGKAPIPSADLELWKVRSPLTARLRDPKYDRFTSFGDWTNANNEDQKVTTPFRINWVRRYEGTTKHASTCGGGRIYTHTAEGQIFAVEQESGRLLWKRYFPGVHISYTSPLYFKERLLVPQAGLKECRLRCLDAATGKLLWEAPFTGSPGWTRQMPPVIYKNLAVYSFSTGKYGGSDSIAWLKAAGGLRNYPADHHPLVRAFDVDTGETVWERDFSEFGHGGDESGLCLLEDKLYYSCFFGCAPEKRRGDPGPTGITASLEPSTGKTIWLTTEYSITGHCTISGKDGSLYLAGFNKGRHVVCLNAKDGSLAWKSASIQGNGATPVVSIGTRFLLAHSQNTGSSLLDRTTGKLLVTFAEQSRCTRFTLSEPFVCGANLDIYDLSDLGNIRLISSGPRLDASQCCAAIVSNGRIFSTAQGGGIQVGMLCGTEAGRMEWTPSG